MIEELLRNLAKEWILCGLIRGPCTIEIMMPKGSLLRIATDLEVRGRYYSSMIDPENKIETIQFKTMDVDFILKEPW